MPCSSLYTNRFLYKNRMYSEQQSYSIMCYILYFNQYPVNTKISTEIFFFLGNLIIYFKLQHTTYNIQHALIENNRKMIQPCELNLQSVLLTSRCRKQNIQSKTNYNVTSHCEKHNRSRFLHMVEASQATTQRVPVSLCVCIGLLCGDPLPSRDGCPG